MKNVVIFCLLLAMPQMIFSQTFDVFEPCKYGQPLINAIQTTYTPSQTLGYGPARDILYSEIDNVGNDLFGIYTNFKVTLDPTQDPSISAYQNGNGINAEHVYPQSKGAGSEPMKSDMHNIRPSRVQVNSARGNCHFDDINDANTSVWYFEGTSSSSIPSSNIDAYSEKDDSNCEFEPREAKKGDIARAIFYFYAIYQNTANSADPNFFNIQKDKLLEWHYTDLPDSVELARSAAIAQRQGNENPFALDTSLAKRAFFMADASYPAGDPNCYDQLSSIYDLHKNDWIKLRSNLVSEEVVLESKIEMGTVQIFDLNGSLITETALSFQTTIQVHDLAKGIYIIRALTENKLATFKIFIQ